MTRINGFIGGPVALYFTGECRLNEIYKLAYMMNFMSSCSIPIGPLLPLLNR